MQEYQTTEQQQRQLTEDGYVLLPDAIPGDLLTRWQKLAVQIESEALAAHEKGNQLEGVCVLEDPVGPRLVRYDDLLGRDADAVLDLLACPAMMAVSAELCGPGAIPLQCDILFKHQHPHPVILWHQGAPHPRGFPYLNVGIYLDNADQDDGCLRYVPGTQRELQDIAQLSRDHGWEIPGVVEQPARAGDILVQDMMVLHGSPPKRTPNPRRTIYVEIRPAAGVIESGQQSEEWLDLRRRWMGLVLRRAAASNAKVELAKDIPEDLKSDEEEVDRIRAHWEPPIPAVYAVENIERHDYPIPADLSGSPDTVTR